jgi:hypothetical protein
VEDTKPEIPDPSSLERGADQNRYEAEDHKGDIGGVNQDDRIRKPTPAHGSDDGSLPDRRRKPSLQAETAGSYSNRSFREIWQRRHNTGCGLQIR